jgi:hypothetical protein
MRRRRGVRDRDGIRNHARPEHHPQAQEGGDEEEHGPRKRHTVALDRVYSPGFGQREDPDRREGEPPGRCQQMASRQDVERPEYVKRQLGHASIELTVDTYGKWLPRGNKAAVDRLDDHASGSKVVANGAGSSSGAPQVPEKTEATRRNRTGDLLIANQLGKPF